MRSSKGSCCSPDFFIQGIMSFFYALSVEPWRNLPEADRATTLDAYSHLAWCRPCRLGYQGMKFDLRGRDDLPAEMDNQLYQNERLLGRMFPEPEININPGDNIVYLSDYGKDRRHNPRARPEAQRLRVPYEPHKPQ